MSLKRPSVTDANRYVLVLWGPNFDEIAASIFVGELRRLGFRVKVVGLNMQQTTGRHGLALLPDLTLDRALRLADRTCCAILPCALATVRQFSYDPRVAELFRRLHGNQAKLVVGAPDAASSDESAFLGFLEGAVEYPEVGELLAFVWRLAELLKTK